MAAPNQTQGRLADAERAVTTAEREMGRARQLLESLRAVHIGRLSLLFWQQLRVRPQPLGHGLTSYDVVQLSCQLFETGAGVRMEQVLEVNGAYRVVIEDRFYSHEFYRQAIAKALLAGKLS